MIFVTVGEQLPFDRLIRTVDEFAKRHKKDVFAQIGETEFQPHTINYKKFLGPDEYVKKFSEAEIVVAHAGMGTIITALELGKPLIVMPRQASLGEHRNDHQFATAKKFQKLNYITVVFDEFELQKKISTLAEGMTIVGKTITVEPSPLLITTIRDFIRK